MIVLKAVPMHNTKHSNWILGLGVMVAILLIIASFWLNPPATNSNDTVDKDLPVEIEQQLHSVSMTTIRIAATFIKTLY